MNSRILVGFFIEIVRMDAACEIHGFFNEFVFRDWDKIR